MALADLKVVRVVGRGDLHHPRPEVRRYVVVGNDFHFAVDQRHLDVLANQGLVAFVIGVNGDRFVPKHCFRPGRGNFDVVLTVKSGPIGKWVLHVVESPFVILVDYFDIRQGGPGLRVPVDNVGPTVDQAFLVEVNEDLADRLV